ncbi:hypothetical protein, partial [Shigella boydii]|uniref:hypothetical protein n=1 Tax=Shigella boydii TaxID=621 RepID=UPI000C1120E5
ASELTVSSAHLVLKRLPFPAVISSRQHASTQPDSSERIGAYRQFSTLSPEASSVSSGDQ